MYPAAVYFVRQLPWWWHTSQLHDTWQVSRWVFVKKNIVIRYHISCCLQDLVNHFCVFWIWRFILWSVSRSFLVCVSGLCGGTGPSLDIHGSSHYYEVWRTKTYGTIHLMTQHTQCTVQHSTGIHGHSCFLTQGDKILILVSEQHHVAQTSSSVHGVIRTWLNAHHWSWTKVRKIVKERSHSNNELFILGQLRGKA